MIPHQRGEHRGLLAVHQNGAFWEHVVPVLPRIQVCLDAHRVFLLELQRRRLLFVLADLYRALDDAGAGLFPWVEIKGDPGDLQDI